MLQFLQSFFGEGLFIPHGHCYLWNPGLVGLHIISDSLIALAYYSIALTLTYFVSKRRDIPFNRIFLLFGAFIIACATGHVMDIWGLWYPNYWLSGFVKAFTAVVSSYTAFELVSLLPQALPEDQANFCTAQDREALSSGRLIDNPAEPVQTHRGQRIFNITKIPIFDEVGKPQYVSGIAEDITERKQVEEALRQSEARFQRLVENVPGVIYQYRQYPDGTDKFTYVSPGIRDIYEFEPKTALQSMELMWAIVHPDDLSALRASVHHSAQTVEPWSAQWRIITPSGTLKWLQGVSRPERQPDGTLIWDGLLLDISDRIQAEQAQARLTAILEATPDIIGICNATGGKIYINPAGRQFHGIEPDGNITCHQISECHPKEVADFILNQAIPTAIAKGIWRGETTWQRWDGEVFSASQVIIAHKSERGDVEYISTIARDISNLKRAEAALQESEERFRALFEQAAVGIVQVSLSGEFLQVNQRFCDLMGYTESELLARTCQELIHPDDLKLTLEYQRRMLAGDIPTYSIEKRYIRSEGQVQWVNSTVSLVRDFQGLPAYFIKVIEDIGERQAALRERKLAEAALQRQLAAVEAARDGIGILNSAQEYIYLNKEHVRLYGYDSSTQLLGKTWRELYYPDEIRRFEQDIFPILSRQGHWHGEAIGKKRDGSTFVQEVSLTLTADGGLICVCRDITERKRVEIARQQQVERERLVGAISMRIRQSLELEKILNTTVTEVRQFLASDRVLIYRFNPDWSGQVVVESVGADWMAVMGSSIHDPCFGKDYPQLYQQGRIGAVANIYTASLTPCYLEFLAPLQVTASLTVPILVGEKLWGLLIAHHCCGERQWQSYEIELLQQLATQVAIAVQQSELYQQVQEELVVRQLAEEALRQSEARFREKAQELELTLKELQGTQSQLIQSEKMSSLGQMIAGIAHEINNPVGFIYANIQPAAEYAIDLLHLVELYQQHYPTPVAEISEQLERIEPDFIKEDFPKLLASLKDGADRICQIVLSLRNFSRLDEAERKRVDIHEGIDNTLLILQHRLKQQSQHRRIQIIKDYGQLPTIECYPSELNQVVMHILCNAIDAIDEAAEYSDLSGIIRIVTDVIKGDNEEAIASWVTLRIINNGRAIKPEVLPKIFDPFFTTKPPGKGTGLGLAICYQIVVDKHGGHLTCHSVDGQETEFAIELPISCHTDSSPV